MNDLEFHPSDDNSENESSSECSDEEEEDIEDSVDFGEQSFVESSDDDREDFDNNGEKNVSEDQSEELVIVAPDSEQDYKYISSINVSSSLIWVSIKNQQKRRDILNIYIPGVYNVM